MAFSIETVREMLAEAFDAGYNGSCEMKDDCVAEILAKNESKNKASSTEDFRVYTVEELQKYADGTVFEFKELGKGTVSTNHGTKFMMFENTGFAPAAFLANEYPWDMPMKLVSRA